MPPVHQIIRDIGVKTQRIETMTNEGNDMKKLLIVLAAMACLGQSAQAADATADFSIASNPNGAWSYGYTTTLGGTFVAYSTGSAVIGFGTSGTLDAWNKNNAPTYVPWVGKAGAGGWTCCTSVTVAANTITMHPGGSGEFSVVRYTAPSAGSYQFTGSFFGQDNGGQVNGTTTDVHVRATNDVFTDTVVGFGNTKTFNGVVALTAGQTLDFVVGVGVGLGNQNNYYNDSTGLIASVTAVPEPSGVILAFAGLALAAGAGVRRRNR
jgi:hypothetical protein